jgi:hypothetical protein
MRPRFPVSLPLTAALLLVGIPALAIETPGSLSFSWRPEPQEVFQSPEQLPAGLTTERIRAEAYLGSAASRFDPPGVQIWAWFVDPSSQRSVLLWMDLDLARLPGGRTGVLPAGAAAIRYLEKHRDTVLFRGEPSWIRLEVTDTFLPESGAGGIEGTFELILGDAGGDPGCRLLLDGNFTSVPSPARLRSKTDGAGGDPLAAEGRQAYSGSDPSGEEVVTGCLQGLSSSGDDSYDTDTDTDYDYDDGEDADQDSGWEGDTFDDGSDDSGWEGDTWDDGSSDSEDDGDTAPPPPSPLFRGASFGALSQYLPLLMVLTVLLRRRLGSGR